MGFIQDYFRELSFQNHKVVLEERGISSINTKALIFQNALCQANLNFLHHRIKKLSLSDLVFQGRRNLDISKKSLKYYLKVELPQRVTKIKLERLQNETTRVSLSTQSICNEILFSWSEINTRINILDHFHPTSLPKTETRLGEDAFETLVIGVDFYVSS